VMADIATFDEAILAAEFGAEIVATTLCGYTKETAGTSLPAFDLIERLATHIKLPIICEGGVASPDDVRRVFDCGAFAVVVGTAITGITQLVQNFVAATPRIQL
jgi:N-acylglucosamine-6-phosphate 2-epimerase